MPAPWSGMAGDPAPTDVVFVAVVRLPSGEGPFMHEAVEEDAPTMNATSAVQATWIQVTDIPDSDLETALRALGVWDEGLVR